MTDTHVINRKKKYKVEPFDVWHYLNGYSYHYKPLINCRVDIEGHLDDEVLRQAVSLSKKTIPLMGCAFNGRSFVPQWIDKNYNGDHIVKLIESDGDVEELVHKDLLEGLDIEIGPQIRITVVRGLADDVLSVTVSHLVCDGAGLKQYLYLVSEIYTKILNGEEPPAQTYERRGTDMLVFKDGKKNKDFSKGIHIDPFYTIEGISQVGVDIKSGNEGLYVISRAFPKNVFSNFITVLKMNDATVNDGLVTLFSRAFCKTAGIDRLTLPSTIDFRKYIPDGVKYGISNYSGYFRCDVRVGPDDTLIDTLKQVVEQTRVIKVSSDVARIALRWDMTVKLSTYPILKWLYPKIFRKLPISMSNAGIVDVNRLKFDSLPIKNACIMPHIKARPNLFTIVSTFDGICTFSCSISGTEGDRHFIEKLYDCMLAEAAALM